jgi:transposase-like protein
MTSKKETAAQTDKVKRKRPANTPSSHTASEKAQAVLAIWTERVKTKEVMNTMGVTYMMLQQWQERAMEGMLQALEPRVNLADGAVLSPRIRALLDKRQQQVGKEKLTKRLAELQGIAPEGKPPIDP